MTRPSVERAVAQCLAAHELEGRHVTVGLSGGLDSVVLLHALVSRAEHAPPRPSALHVHHGLSPHADRWTEHCAALCAEWRVPLQVVRVSLDPADRRGTEGAARAARYDAYADCETDAIALAHHADDQAETVLLQLLRGAGLPGLSAMPDHRPLRRGLSLIRPLLGLPRSTLHAYARERGLVWIEDESNDDDRYRRNALRLHVMPALEAHFPGYRQTLGRVAQNAADAAHLAEVLGGLDLPACEVPDGLSIRALAALDPVRRVNAVRTWLRRQEIALPPRDALLDGLAQFLSSSENAQPELRFGAHRLMRYRDRLSVVGPAPEASGEWRYVWHGETEFTLPDGRVWCARAVTGTGVRACLLARGEVALTPRLGGERLRIAPNRPRRRLKNLLQESGVPGWVREALVIIRLEGVPVQVPGVGTDADHAAGAGEAGWVFAQVTPPPSRNREDACR